jgi:elongator complex protein 3
MDLLESFSKEIIKQIKKRKIKDQNQFNKLKLELLKRYKVKKIPTNAEITAFASSFDRNKLRHILSMKPTRTLSGVAVVAVMTKPLPCPHGKCAICPGGVDSVFGNVPQSYTGKEPATRRAIRNKYNPYLQVFNRLEQYIAMNRTPDKVELIVMGGTFLSFPVSYQNTFVTYSLKAMNDFSKLFFRKGLLDIKKFNEFFELPGDIDNKARIKRIHQRILKYKKKSTLEKEQLLNEKSKVRCVGLTLETRPDYGMLKHGNQALKLGCTRIELGVQSVFPKSLELIERGHTVGDSIKSIKTLKDLGFKLNFHYMPGLPKISLEKDLLGMLELFANEDYKPDMLKIYPCMVVKGTKLYDLWKNKKYKPMTTKEAAALIAEFKQYVPRYCRIMRVQRDIPTFMTEAGVDRTNLRQYIDEFMKKHDIKCDCIRCREAGIKLRDNKIKILKRNIHLVVDNYKASDGTEFFISFEDLKNDILFGFCRVRVPSQYLRKEITNDCILVRELHVYGETTELGQKGLVQHKGMGRALLREAERIAKMYWKKRVVVISGIGVRPYYKKLGYKREGPYMVKRL